jgi:PAS domain S-box-containing protein
MLNVRSYQQAIDSKLETIMLQLVPNGGSSIRDALDRIENRQHVLGAFQKAQLNTHAKAMFETDNAGQCTWVNRPHNRLTGYQATEMLGDGWINAIAPECRTTTMRKWEDAVKNKREFDEDLWYLRPDRQTRYKVNVHAYTVAGKTGCIEGYLGEITDLHQSQTEPITCAEFTPMVS